MNRSKTHLLLGTRKGLVIYKKVNYNWKYQDVHFLGIPVTMVFADYRNDTWWICLDHGHWGVKLHRSNDKGKNWEEIEAPKYPEGYEVKDGEPASTKYLWAMAGGGDDQPDTLWIGTVPGGLFKSEDGGKSFQLIESLWNHPSRKEHWFGGGFDNAGIHSIVVDQRNSNRILVGISCAGVFETLDGGDTWTVRNKGLRADFLPDPFSEVGHDPHLLLASQTEPDVMWQQNHCGIFVSNDSAATWQDVTEKDGLANFGFTIAVDEKNANRAWVVPSVSDVIRTSIGNSLCVCRTDDGGKSWKTFREGLPQDACFDIVYRHALDITDNELVFGTTCGNLFLSQNHGETWQSINNYLPMIHCVKFV